VRLIINLFGVQKLKFGDLSIKVVAEEGTLIFTEINYYPF